MSNHSQANLNRKQNANLRTISGQNASTSINALKSLQTKTFTNGVDPTETLSSATEKQFSIVGGVDLSTSSFSKVNPIKVDDNGLLECKMIGNTSGDGTGSSHHLHIDSNGNAKTIVVNSLNVIPANSVNGDITDDPANSVAVSLKGRTTIGDSSTSTFLKCDSNGNLELNDSTNGAKLDAIKNGQTQNGDGTGNKLGVICDAINTNTITQNGKIDTVNTNLGDIETEVAKTQTSVHTTNVSGIAPDSGGTTYDLGVNFFRFQKLKISGDMINTTPMNLYIQLSSDGSNWTWATGIGFVGVSGGGYGGAFFNTSIDNPLR